VLSRGSAKKVTIYVNEDTRHHRDSLWSAIVHFLKARHVTGATVLRPMAGFGSHETIHSPEQEARAEHMPLRIEFIDSAAKVDEILPTLYEMVEDGVIEVQDTSIIKAVRKGGPPQPHLARTEMKGTAKLIRIFLGEDDEANGEPLFEAIVKRLMMMEVAGATVYRGILGYGARRHTHREKLFRISNDRPVMISVVDSPERADEILDAVAPMIQNGLIVLSDVEAHRFVHVLPDEGDPDVSTTAR